MPPPFRPANDPHPPFMSALLLVACLVVGLLAFTGGLYVVFGVLMRH